MASLEEKNKTTHFGFKTVAAHEKVERVGAVFHSVADRYDCMNDAMSFGMHRLWKREAISHLRLQPHHRILDLAAGTGDMAGRIKDKCGAVEVVMADINASMLRLGRDRLLDAGHYQGLSATLANGEHLPFAEDAFDRCVCSFGIRNMTDIPVVLKECLRVLKPGGFLLVLEFSEVEVEWMKPGYDAYSFGVIPKVGGAIAGDEASYQYLVESIRKHPGRAAFRELCYEAGFDRVDDWALLGGVVAIHKAVKA